MSGRVGSWNAGHLGGACCSWWRHSAPSISAQKNGKDKDKDQKDSTDPRPKVTLRANPVIAMAPARVVFTAELTGGANDFEEFYCGAVEWEWGDGTKSESSSDCAPYAPGKSEIKRRFAVEHVFRAGAYRVMFPSSVTTRPSATRRSTSRCGRACATACNNAAIRPAR
jgi:hypothetical protein